jgi:hypothetical protein
LDKFYAIGEHAPLRAEVQSHILPLRLHVYLRHPKRNVSLLVRINKAGRGFFGAKVVLAIGPAEDTGEDLVGSQIEGYTLNNATTGSYEATLR